MIPSPLPAFQASPRAGPRLLAAAALGLSLGASLVWLAADRIGPVYDVFWYFQHSLRVHEYLRAGEWSPSQWGVVGAGQRYGALPLLGMALLQLLFGTRYPVAVLLMAALSLFLLSWTVFRITAAHAGERMAGVAVALLTLCPGVWGYQRLLLLDLPMSAFIAGSVGLLHSLAPGGGRRFRGVRGVGALLLAGAAVSFKVNAMAFLILPLLVGVLLAGLPLWRRRGSKRLAILLILLSLSAISLLVGAAVGIPVWRGGGTALLATFSDDTWLGTAPALAREGKLRELPGLYAQTVGVQAHAVWRLGSTQLLNLPLGLAFLGSLGFLAWVRHPFLPWLLAWVGPPLAFLVLVFRGEFDERYLLPAVPALIIAVALGLASLPGRRLGALVASALLGLSLVQFGTGSFALPSLEEDRWCFVRDQGRLPFYAGTSGACLLQADYTLFYRSSVPSRPSLPRAEVREVLAARRHDLMRPLRVSFAGALSPLFFSYLQELLWGERLGEAPGRMLLPANLWYGSGAGGGAPLLDPASSLDLPSWHWAIHPELKKGMLDSDAVVVRHHPDWPQPGVQYGVVPNHLQPVAWFLGAAESTWERAGGFPVPGGTDIIEVYLPPKGEPLAP